jgi:hypothetical protein
MSQCLHAAEAMFQVPMPPPVISPLKRKSLGDLPDYVSKRQAIASPDEVSPRGFIPGPGIQPAPGAHPVSIQPRPNGYVPGPPVLAPAVSASPYNPTPTSRKRGRPPKAIQNTWQVSTYQPITPAPAAPSPATTAAPQPHSPGVHAHHGAYSTHGMPDPRARKRALPEIAPRPVVEPLVRSPAVPGADYQNWRDETARKEYYHGQAAEPEIRERFSSTYTPILPRPRSPLPPMRELPRPASAEPRHFGATPPASALGQAETDSESTTTAPIKIEQGASKVSS